MRGADGAVHLHWEAVLVSTVEVGGLRGFWGLGGERMRSGAKKRADGLNYDAYYGK